MQIIIWLFHNLLTRHLGYFFFPIINNAVNDVCAIYIYQDIKMGLLVLVSG